MHLTDTHSRFWLWHRGPACLPRKGLPPSIHSVVNEHDTSRYPYNTHAQRPTHGAGNAVALLRLARRHEPNLYAYLCELAAPNSWGARNKTDRYPYLVRWLRRWTHARQAQRANHDYSGVC